MIDMHHKTVLVTGVNSGVGFYAAAEPQLAAVTGRFFFKSKELATKPITHDSGIAARLAVAALADRPLHLQLD
jgi:hypothetical protein